MSRARGRRVHLRPFRRRGDADVRRAGRFQDQADPRAPRAGRHPHGRWLRALHGQARRGARDLGPRRHQHRDGAAHGAHGLGADHRDLRPDDLADARQGRIPGGRRHGDHLSRGQALVSGQGRPRHPAHRARGLPRRNDGPPGPGADRRAQGHRPGALPRAVHGQARPARLQRAQSRRRRTRSPKRRGCSPRAGVRCSTWVTAP